MDPYLDSGKLYMHIMSTLIAIDVDLVDGLRVKKQKYGLFWTLIWPLSKFLFLGCKSM